MNLLPAAVAEVIYLAAAVCFILALKGLSSPRGARRGNLIGALGAAIAVVTVLLSTDFHGANLAFVLGSVGIGSAVAVPAARRVKMTEMPQLVAIFNGVGGGAAAVVGVIELAEWTGTEP
ncbi:MAG: NAD(P)(+) transhydrogenase (Re/Si-specific) subunit beta, partial [Actinomycetes bacterium]